MKVHAAALLLVAALGALLVRDALDPTSPCTGDEPGWIASGALTFELVRDAAGPARWASAYDALGLGDWGNKNPPLGKLLIGAAVARARRPGDTLRYGWNFALGADRNAATGRVPPPHLLAAARLAIALCGVATLLLAYVLAVQLVGARIAALLAPLLLFLVPAFVEQATHVDTDVPQVLLLLASAAALVAALRAAGRRSAVLLGAAAVLAGLSCAVKLSSGPMPAALAIAVLLAPGWASRHRLLGATLALVVPVVAFVGVTPYLWPRPLGRSLEIVRAWRATKVAQRSEGYLAGSAVTTRGRAIELVLLQGVLWPTRVVTARGETSERITRASGAAALLLVGLLLGVAGRGTPESAERRRWRAATAVAALATLLVLLLTGAPGVVPALVGLGLGALGAGARAPAETAAAARALLALLATFALFTALWLPFDWPRYYLPVLLWVPPVLAAGAGALGSMALSAARARDRAAPTATPARRRSPAAWPPRRFAP